MSRTLLFFYCIFIITIYLVIIEYINSQDNSQATTQEHSHEFKNPRIDTVNIKDLKHVAINIHGKLYNYICIDTDSNGTDGGGGGWKQLTDTTWLHLH